LVISLIANVVFRLLTFKVLKLPVVELVVVIVPDVAFSIEVDTSFDMLILVTLMFWSTPVADMTSLTMVIFDPAVSVFCFESS